MARDEAKTSVPAVTAVPVRLMYPALFP